MNAVLDLLLPCRCVACEALCLGPGSRVWCARCAQGLPPWLWPRRALPEGLRSAWTLGPYDGPVGAAVRRAKYGADRLALAELGERLAQAAAGRLPRVDAVVPVPQRRWSTLTRGLWPTALLAAPVAQALAVPALHALRRRGGRAQAGLDHAARLENVRVAFEAQGTGVPARVLLVDDVMTTGATAQACAEELLCAGAREVHLLAACDA